MSKDLELYVNLFAILNFTTGILFTMWRKSTSSTCLNWSSNINMDGELGVSWSTRHVASNEEWPWEAKEAEVECRLLSKGLTECFYFSVVVMVQVLKNIFFKFKLTFSWFLWTRALLLIWVLNGGCGLNSGAKFHFCSRCDTEDWSHFIVTMGVR